MKILMLTWEFPPYVNGGLATASYGIAKALLKKGVEIFLLLPTKKDVYFHLRKVEDVDNLPVSFFEKSLEHEFNRRDFSSKEEELNFLGIITDEESYFFSKSYREVTLKKIVVNVTESERKIIENIWVNLMGDEDIFTKVRILTERVIKYAYKLDFDIIHAHDWLTYPAGMALKSITGKPLVAHVHATEFDRAGGFGDERIHNIEYNGMLYADIVAPVSYYTKKIIMNHYLVDERKIIVVHDAHNIDVSELKRKKKLFNDPIILFLGRITIQKGPEYFVKLARKVLDKHPKVHFIMAGSGDMFYDIVHKSASMRLKNKMLFAGFLNFKEVNEILDLSDIFIMPSVSEPFGIAPLEAMAHGVVSIISKQSGVAEVVENAIKVDFWDIDKMAEFVNYYIEHPHEREALANKAKDEVQKIRWDKSADVLIDIYNRIKVI